MADKIPDISPNVDETMKELETHGSFELPVETYTDNCEIFRSLYNHWHKEMEIICIDKGNGLARLNRETLRLKEGDLLIVNSGVLHGIKSDSRHILYYRSVVFDLSFLAGPAGDLCQEKVISLLMETGRIHPSDHSCQLKIIIIISIFSARSMNATMKNRPFII